METLELTVREELNCSKSSSLTKKSIFKMTKEKFILRDVAMVIACLVVTSMMFLGCNKPEDTKDPNNPDNPDNPDIPSIINVGKGLSYSEVLENLTANGYVPSEKTDSTIVFKGADLEGIHPLADFLTDYIINSSKQVTYIFDEEGGLLMLKMEGNSEVGTPPFKSLNQKKMDSFSEFLEDSKDFVREQYESMHVMSVPFNADCFNGSYMPRKDSRCVVNHFTGQWDATRLSCQDMNIYFAWWYYRANEPHGGVVVWLLPIPNNKPDREPTEDWVKDFECYVWYMLHGQISIAHDIPCTH